MSEHVYKYLDLVGSSQASIEDAVNCAVGKASKTVHNIRWVEIGDVRGDVKDGKVAHWQVTMRVGFTLD